MATVYIERYNEWTKRNLTKDFGQSKENETQHNTALYKRTVTGWSIIILQTEIQKIGIRTKNRYKHRKTKIEQKKIKTKKEVKLCAKKNHQ